MDHNSSGSQRPAASVSNSCPEDTDFLLAATLFQKQAAASFGNDNNFEHYIHARYFTSQWMQEIPTGSGTLTKKAGQVYCPYCGLLRDGTNTTVRLGSRKKQSRGADKWMNRINRRRTSRDVEALTSTAILDQKKAERFMASKNCMVYRCLECKRTWHQEGISRAQQKDLVKTSSVPKLPLKQPEIFPTRTPSTMKKTGKLASVIQQHFSFSAPASPCSSISANSTKKKKKRKRDATAGLLIPPSIVQAVGKKGSEGKFPAASALLKSASFSNLQDKNAMDINKRLQAFLL